MWEMFDDDFHCDECGGPGPPPKFMIPPPPRPPFMNELTKCSAEDALLVDYDMCEAIPILDASYHSSPSLQTSAMIAVFSLLLVLVVLISSLFVWKHKRKVQNFLPCKTPTRGGHLSGAVTGGHSVTYEDPDAHLGHRPLVMRHHHNVEMLPPKSIHYPSGYPMTRTPPLFVCSSPGPDPYRSNDNVYEELGPGRDSDGEYDPPLHSDDDFAEDELSLPGERSFHKVTADGATGGLVGGGSGVATIYHERMNTPNNNSLNPGHERNSVISSSTSSSNTGGSSDHRGVLAGLVRPFAASVGRRRPFNSSTSSNKTSSSRKHGNSMSLSTTTTTDDLNTSSEHTTGSDIVPSVYDDRNLMSLTFNNHHHHPHNHHAYYANNSLVNSSNNNNNVATNSSSNSNNNNNALTSNRLHYYAKSSPGLACLDSEVERRNRINKQMHHAPPPAVSTIFRERGNYNSLSRAPQYPQPYYTHHSLINNHHQTPGHPNHALQHRSRTNPRSLDRRRIAVPIDHEPSYGYAEPVFHEALIYDACLAHPNNVPASYRTQHQPPPPAYPSIMPDYTTSYRTLANGLPSHYHHPQPPPQLPPPNNQDLLQPQIYSRDSSFGSDSGYSHQTSSTTGATGCAGSGRPAELGSGGGNAGLNRTDSGSFSNSNSCGRPTSGGSKIGLSFAWNRRGVKDNIATTTTPPPSSLSSTSNTSGLLSATSASTPANKVALADTESPVAGQQPESTISTKASSCSNATTFASGNNNNSSNSISSSTTVSNINNNNATTSGTTNMISSSCPSSVPNKSFEDS